MLDSWTVSIFFLIVSFGAVQFYEVTEGRVRANMLGFFVLLGIRTTLMGSFFVALPLILTAFSQPPRPEMLVGGVTAFLGITAYRHVFGKPAKPRS